MRGFPDGTESRPDRLSEFLDPVEEALLQETVNVDAGNGQVALVIRPQRCRAVHVLLGHVKPRGQNQPRLVEGVEPGVHVPRGDRQFAFREELPQIALDGAGGVLKPFAQLLINIESRMFERSSLRPPSLRHQRG